MVNCRSVGTHSSAKKSIQNQEIEMNSRRNLDMHIENFVKKLQRFLKKY